ncbi:hypothetical protein ACRWQL_10945 [Shewanella sp. HL-SH4]|uniref:hypothetical protein n=1 Tax=Shewanella sp. HL-SH4 TaxID=3436240 RepID=UPI003EBF502B
MYSMLKDLFDKYRPKPLFTLVIMLPISMCFTVGFAYSNNLLTSALTNRDLPNSALPSSILPNNDLPITGDWLYQSANQMALLHINPDTSYSHIFINLDEPNSSFHHWGRIKQQTDALQFIPSELVFYRQQSLQAQFVAAQSLVTQPAELPEITKTDLITHDLVTQPIHYSLSAANALLTLSSEYGDVDILGQQYQALERHHTFGYWPDKLAVDISYCVIFANGYYAQVYSSSDQAISAEFVWGRLF